jgi:hypothetical protein
VEPGPSIDNLMAQATDALTRMDYLTCEALCLRAAEAAGAAGAWDAYARVLLPLQESRRQRRLIAADGAIRLGSGGLDLEPATMLAALKQLGAAGGCLVVTSPARRDDAAAIERAARAERLYVEVLYAEPAGAASGSPQQWLVMSPTHERPRCQLPAPATELRDRWLVGDGGDPAAVRRRQAAAWFLAAGEALGDAALAAMDATAPAARRMAQLQAALEAVTDHELLHQRLFDAAAQLAAQLASDDAGGDAGGGSGDGSGSGGVGGDRDGGATSRA